MYSQWKFGPVTYQWIPNRKEAEISTISRNQEEVLARGWHLGSQTESTAFRVLHLLCREAEDRRQDAASHLCLSEFLIIQRASKLKALLRQSGILIYFSSQCIGISILGWKGQVLWKCADLMLASGSQFLASSSMAYLVKFCGERRQEGGGGRCLPVASVDHKGGLAHVKHIYCFHLYCIFLSNMFLNLRTKAKDSLSLQS